MYGVMNSHSILMDGIYVHLPSELHCVTNMLSHNNRPQLEENRCYYYLCVASDWRSAWSGDESVMVAR